MNKQTSKEKSRYFTFLLYPESVPEDWLTKLETLDVPMAISPLHDKDESPLGGYKKPHWHVIYVAKNPVTAESVRIKIKRLLGEKSIAKVQIVEQGMESMYLYLTHESKDAIAKHKHVYPKSEIRLLNNFDIDRYVVFDVTEQKELKYQLVDLIFHQRIVNISDLMGYLNTAGFGELSARSMKHVNEVISGNTGFFKLCFDANYQNGFRARYCARVSIATGEVVDPWVTEPSEGTEDATEPPESCS